MIKRLLYLLLGSRHSQEAEHLLQDEGLDYEKVVVSDRTTLAAIHRDLGIGELPTLVAGNKQHAGLEQIKNFVKSERGQ